MRLLFTDGGTYIEKYRPQRDRALFPGGVSADDTDSCWIPVPGHGVWNIHERAGIQLRLSHADGAGDLRRQPGVPGGGNAAFPVRADPGAAGFADDTGAAPVLRDFHAGQVQGHGLEEILSYLWHVR